MEQSLLCKIPWGINMHFFDGWANGAIGTMQDRKGTGIYRFYKGRIGSNGTKQLEELVDEKDAPIVAAGIVAYWLHYGTIPNRPPKNTYAQPKSVLEVFECYTAKKLNDYKIECELKPSSWRRDLERDFYTQYIIPYEKRLMKQSEALFEYITPDDRQVVRDIMNEYILYIINYRTERGYHVSDELKVLRAIAYEDEFMLEDLEHYEVTTILDDLEDKGYVEVAWVEGHDYEDVRMLDKGWAYMKQLETGKTQTVKSRQQMKDLKDEQAGNDVPEEEKQDEKVLYNKVSFEFFLRLLEHAGLDINNTGNKTRAGDLWHMMTGKSADEIRRFCSSRAYYNNHTKGDIKRLNELLSDMGITSIVLQ